jgi:TATA-binding protein-associated factor Taf7
MAPRDVPPQPEPQPDSPQYAPLEEDPLEIMAMVPTGEEAQEAMEEAQQLP